MEELLSGLKAAGFQGDIKTDAETRNFYSHDASMFEIIPEAVVAPKDAKDVETLVAYVANHKKDHKKLSLTGRSAGTDMAGGAINESIIVSFTDHMNHLVHVTDKKATSQPGVYYRDFEKETLLHGALMPSYPASKDLAAIGGIVNNNSGGEKSLEYGKTADWIREIKLVFADGVERTVKPLKKAELDKKRTQKDFEGKVYREIFELCEKHYDVIKTARPQVSKNSMGYGIWDVWDRESGIFDLTRLIVGSEGTLGLTTEVTFELVKKKAHSGLLVFFLKDISKLGELITTVLKHKPATFEGFDDQTMILFFKLMPSLLKVMGPKDFTRLLFSLIPQGFMVMKGYPKLVLMVEFNGDSVDEVRDKIRALNQELKLKKHYYKITASEENATEEESEKFWLMRRKSFQLLRSKVKDKHTAPFIDDFIIKPEYLSEFLPKLQKIIRKYRLFATIAGHMGDGNFHVIPLMKIEEKRERKKILPAMKEVNELVLKYGGSLSGEHNDGLVRGPWLERQFGKEMLGVFKQAKKIMDPDSIFNPKKKADADWDYSFNRIRKNF
ncbi:MAG: FAD-binding oxidoreductase [Candidatus Saccharimonadales bacterium]